MRVWWRRNRWALLALPFALAFALAGSSSLVKTYWWDSGFRGGVVAESDTVAFHEEYDDGYLRYPIEGEVRLTGYETFAPEDVVEGTVWDASDVTTPRGTRIWGFALEFTVDPDVVLSPCFLGVVGDDGRYYELDDRALPGLRQVENCAPDDRPGPTVAPGETRIEPVAAEQARPGTWEKYVFGPLPASVEPAYVRLWFLPPEHFDIPVSEAAHQPGPAGDPTGDAEPADETDADGS